MAQPKPTRVAQPTFSWLGGVFRYASQTRFPQQGSPHGPDCLPSATAEVRLILARAASMFNLRDTNPAQRNATAKNEERKANSPYHTPT